MKQGTFIHERCGRLFAAVALIAGAMSAAVVPADAVERPAIGLHSGKDDSIEQYERFGAWLGEKVLYRVVFADMNTWDGIASPWFIGTSRRWIESDPRRVEVISLPLLPKTDKGDFAAVIAGRHDAKFRSFAEKVEARRMASRVIVRLGWEGNGDWYPWAYGSNPAGFRGAFRRAVHVMRRAAPDLRFEWCVSSRAVRKGGPAHWTEGYPGEDVVDIISMDTYDEYNMTWKSLLEGEAGLRELREFAIAHGKPEAYPEWGCSTNSSAQGGGDNVEFIEKMAEWFEGRPGGVLYQAYWNTGGRGPNAAIHGPNARGVPRAAAAFRRIFGQSPDSADSLRTHSQRQIQSLAIGAAPGVASHGPTAGGATSHTR